MRSDGLEFVVAAFILVMAAMIVGGFVLFYLAGRRLFPGPGRGHQRLGFGFIGLALGLLCVVAVFFEDLWSPPPRVRLDVPPGFSHADVILLEDASASTELVWQGVELPFLRKSTTIAVPTGGVKRFRSLQGLAGRGEVDVVWSDGAKPSGMAGGPAPTGSAASIYVMYLRAGGATASPWADDAARGRTIRSREQGGP